MNCRLLSASLAILAIVASCSPAKSATNFKNNFSEYEIVSKQQIKWEEIFLQEENNYIVFFYSETCSYCHHMLNEIVSFANNEILPTYFLNTSENEVTFSNNQEPVIRVDSIEELSIKGTPTIIEIDEGLVTANIAGLDECLTYINDKRMETNIIL